MAGAGWFATMVLGYPLVGIMAGAGTRAHVIAADAIARGYRRKRKAGAASKRDRATGPFMDGEAI